MRLKNMIHRLEEDFLALEASAAENLKEKDLEYALLLDEIEIMLQNTLSLPSSLKEC